VRRDLDVDAKHARLAVHPTGDIQVGIQVLVRSLSKKILPETTGLAGGRGTSILPLPFLSVKNCPSTLVRLEAGGSRRLVIQLPFGGTYLKFPLLSSLIRA